PFDDARARVRARGELRRLVPTPGDSAPSLRHRWDPADQAERVRSALAVFIGVLADELLQLGALRERRLMEVPVVLGDPEIQVRLGAVWKVSERAGRANRL